MKDYQNINGDLIRRRVIASKFSKEDVVVHVQKKGFSFSYPGLDKMYRSELPQRHRDEILEAIAEKCGCSISDFFDEAEDEQTA